MIHRIGHKLKRRDGDDAPESIANFRNDMDLQNTSRSPSTGSVRKSQPRRTHDVMTSFNTNGPRTRIIAQRLSVRNLLTATQPSPLATNRRAFAFPDFTCRGWVSSCQSRRGPLQIRTRSALSPHAEGGPRIPPTDSKQGHGQDWGSL